MRELTSGIKKMSIMWIVPLAIISLATLSCQSDSASSSRSQAVTPTVSSVSSSETSLIFVPTSTPEPETSLDNVKSELDTPGILFMGPRAASRSFYLLLDKCGGPIEIRDSIVQKMVPSTRLLQTEDNRYFLLGEESIWGIRGGPLGMYMYPIRFDLGWGWGNEAVITWSVRAVGSGDLYHSIAGGSITDNCEVVTGFSERPVTWPKR